MRRYFGVLPLLLVLAACQARPVDTPLPAAPLAVSLSSDALRNVLVFRVNQPAYVAIFAVQPEAGVQQVYPDLGIGRPDDGRVAAGETSVGYPRRPLAYPTHYFLVASTQPLRLEQFRSLAGLRQALGDELFLARDPDAVMERLIELTVPTHQDEASYVTAAHVG